MLNKDRHSYYFLPLTKHYLSLSSPVHFFITWHESVRSAFDIFVLTETKGQRLDLFVGKEGSPIAEKLSHVVLYSTIG